MQPIMQLMPETERTESWTAVKSDDHSAECMRRKAKLEGGTGLCGAGAQTDPQVA